MTARRDAIGNVARALGAARAARRRAPLLLGSHLDTVRDAGRYDGMLGVLVALAVRRGVRGATALPFAVEVLGFADEEGVRYGTAYLGSSVVAGTFDRDGAGAPRRRRRRRWPTRSRAFGGDPAALDGARRDRGDLLGYVEVHIEQGPVLEAEDLPVGVVTGIAGPDARRGRLHRRRRPRRHRADGAAPRRARRRGRVDRRGRGARPRGRRPRRDRRRARGRARREQRHPRPRRRSASTCATSTTRSARPPSPTCASAPRRSPRRAASTRRGPRCRRPAPSPCAPALDGALEAAVADAGVRVARLPSGAGHDAAVMARLCDVAMLFVRCAGGISHNPAEAVTADGRRGRDRRREPPRRGRLAAMTGARSRDPRRHRRRAGRRSPRRRRHRGRRIVAVAPELDGRRARGDRRRPACTSSPAPSTRTCTSTSPAAPTRRASRRARRPPPPAATTTVVDMPLNAHAADDRRARLRREGRRRRAAAPTSTSRSGAASCPATLDRLDELAARGVVGFKAFMSDTAIARVRHAPTT